LQKVTCGLQDYSWPAGVDAGKAAASRRTPRCFAAAKAPGVGKKKQIPRSARNDSVLYRYMIYGNALGAEEMAQEES
jgi:hypothetical protein